MSRLPTALMVLGMTPPAPKSLTLRSMLRAASSSMPPLVSVLRLVPEASRMSRPAFRRIPAWVGNRAALVALTLAPRLMSLAAPLAVSAITPLALLRLPTLMDAALFRVMPKAASSAPVLTPAPLLVTATEPSVALSVSSVMAPAAFTTTSALLATMLPPVGPMLVPAFRAMALPARLMLLPSLRAIEAAAVMSTLPAALMVLGMTPPAPKSLTLRSIAPPALSLMAPEVLDVRLVVEPIRMFRPDETLIAATLSARPAAVAFSAAFTLTSLPAPIALSEIAPLDVVNAPATVKLPAWAVATMPLAATAPKDRLPLACVMLRLPVELTIPLPWVKALLTLRFPPPARVPEFNASCVNEVLPLAVSVPPLKVTNWVKLDVPPSVRLPPDRTKFSSDVSWFAASGPADTVIVCSPATLMLTLCPAVGARPVLQLASTLQSPEVPIQHTSAPQPLSS